MKCFQVIRYNFCASLTLKPNKYEYSQIWTQLCWIGRRKGSRKSCGADGFMPPDPRRANDAFPQAPSRVSKLFVSKLGCQCRVSSLSIVWSKRISMRHTHTYSLQKFNIDNWKTVDYYQVKAVFFSYLWTSTKKGIIKNVFARWCQQSCPPRENCPATSDWKFSRLEWDIFFKFAWIEGWHKILFKNVKMHLFSFRKIEKLAKNCQYLNRKEWTGSFQPTAMSVECWALSVLSDRLERALSLFIRI